MMLKVAREKEEEVEVEEKNEPAEEGQEETMGEISLHIVEG